MSELYARLDYLFSAYYNGTATKAELDEFFEIINSSATDAELASLIHQAWDRLDDNGPLFDRSKSADMLNKILRTNNYEQPAPVLPKHNNLPWKKLGVAASLLFLVGFGAYIYSNQKKQVVTKKSIAKAQFKNDVLPGGNRAVLTLANGKTITLDSARNGLLAQQGTTRVNKTRNGQLVYETSTDADAQASVINTISTPRGGQYQLVLSDGSKVCLNSASSLSFPTKFTGKTREVTITGEAYFEVAKNPKMPFRVKSDNTTVEVLGTHFNIMAYNDEAEMKTTLLEGSVKITNGTASGTLKPGQQALLSKAGRLKVLSNVDVDDEIAWKDGIFQFRDAGIEAIMRQAARWYDVDVAYEGKIPKREFTGRISRNVKASELMSMLGYAGVKFKIEDKRITIQQ
ncbi:FecR domain-containing protein [Mucilaginibacter sp. SMC90]|uniref:FecR family protein n=1 Tax=Mucilaginibacter sp. SMC90 TaxID=2929803 RepID=UPI001FB37957|nr:FecR family protein [Mucilaginibacter sp. SMC90]UOE51831.1 FecR domain-containing protein [Mucilaginibacter sp. SMC90]